MVIQMPKKATVKMNAICPGCYANTGFSIVMQEENEIYKCPKDSDHKYKKNSEGFLEKTNTW